MCTSYRCHIFFELLISILPLDKLHIELKFPRQKFSKYCSVDPHFIRKVGAGVNMLTLKVFSDKYPTALENIKHSVHSSTTVLGGIYTKMNGSLEEFCPVDPQHLTYILI